MTTRFPQRKQYHCRQSAGEGARATLLKGYFAVTREWVMA